MGIPDDKIVAVPAWSTSPLFDARERAVLAYADALVGECGRVPDDLFAELRRHLDDVEILELTYITCLYEMHATMSRGLRTEFDDRDDPIVEFPATPPPWPSATTAAPPSVDAFSPVGPAADSRAGLDGIHVGL